MLYMMEFVSILQQLQQLPLDLPAESINGIVVVVFTTIAAIISVLLDRRKKKRMEQSGGTKAAHDPVGTVQLLEMVFDELKKTTEILRLENQQLMQHNTNLTASIEDCRSKYHQQLEDSARLLEDVRSHKKTIDRLNGKIDNLLKAINEILEEDVRDVLDLEELDIDNS